MSLVQKSTDSLTKFSLFETKTIDMAKHEAAKGDLVWGDLLSAVIA